MPSPTPIGNPSRIGSGDALGYLDLAAYKGGYIAVWTDSSGTSSEIKGRIYRADGTTSEEFSVNQFTGGAQEYAQVAVLADGRFVVTWSTSDGSDGQPDGTRGRIFSSDGSPASDEFAVNTVAPGRVTSPSITALSDGGFVITYPDGYSADLIAQIYNADGSRRGAEFVVSDPLIRNYAAFVLGLENGNFVSVQTHSGNGTDLSAQIFDANGEPVTKRFTISDAADEQNNPVVALLKDGRFVVAWHDRPSDGSEYIKAQIFNPDGSKSGTELDLGKVADGFTQLDVGALSDGGFIVTYSEFGFDADLNVRALTVDRHGVKQGDAILVNRNTDGWQSSAATTVLEDGTVIVGWTDAPRLTVFGQIHTQALDPLLGQFWRGTSKGEEKIGTRFNDTLDGGAGTDTLQGGDGIDHLIGGANLDVLNGGGGFDFASYVTASAGVTIDLRLEPEGVGRGDAAGDLYIDIEGFIGSRHDDVFRGNEEAYNEFRAGSGNDLAWGGNQDDYLDGEDGGDTLEGGAGVDTLDGGEGFDFASYENSSTRVIVNLQTSWANLGDATGDSLRSIEGVIGSAFNDTLTGNGNDTHLIGGAGDDTLRSERKTVLGAGDTLEGGTGADTLSGDDGAAAGRPGVHTTFASYAGARSGGVVANLADSRRNTGDAAGDTYSFIGGLIGSYHADSLTGNIHANTLRGGNGNDTLTGGGGNDQLFGEVGIDTARFSGVRAEYTITSRGDGSWLVTDLVAGRDGSDTIRDIDLLEFADLRVGVFSAAPAGITLSQTQFYENTASGSLLAQLSSSDADGDVVAYSVDATDGPFAIQGDSLILTGSLDYETRTQYSVTVRATDASGGSSVQTFTINVLDVAEPMLLRGISKSNRLTGDAADDTIHGATGNDTLRGEGGNDRLYGGAGKDTLTGGAGKDIFVFDTKPNARTNVDRIVDFDVKDDTIWFDNKFYKSLGKNGSEKKPAALKKAFFTIGNEAKDGNDYLIYDKSNGKLYYDADGSGHGQQLQIATLSKNLKLTNKDFFVI